MVTKDQVFPSRYLKAEDIKGRPAVLVIEHANPELLKNNEGISKDKLVLYFKGHKKALVVNTTNFDSIIDITGEVDSDNWISHSIELYPTTTMMAGKKVDCIRIRAPGRKATPQLEASAKTEGQSGDEVDFGGDRVPF
jgi:hypothetical protein